MNNTLLNTIISASQINNTGVSVVLKLTQSPHFTYEGKQLGLANDLGVTRQYLNTVLKKLSQKKIIKKIKQNGKTIGIRLLEVKNV